jgi:hypothetical protein
MNDVILNFIYRFDGVGFMKGTYCGGVDRGKARGHGVFTVKKGWAAGYGLEGEWENNVIRRGNLKTKDGRNYVGEFAKHGRCFHGHGKLLLRDGVRYFDGEWEKHDGVFSLGCARRGMAVDSDGAVHRVVFQGGRGAWWEEMERAFDAKQSFQYGTGFRGCTGASWTRLPVRADRTSVAIIAMMAAIMQAAVGRCDP